MTDEELELFPTSESALKMLSYVTPGFYDKSYVGKWMFQVMGLEYDKALKLAEELPEQFFPETATWGLCWHEIKWGLPVQENLSYQAFKYCEEQLPAGTYNVIIGDTWGNNCVKGKTYQFTLTKPVPAKGQLAGLYRAPDVSPAEWKVYSFESSSATDPIETVAMVEGTGGTALGTLSSKPTAPLNGLQSVAYGYNRWAQSAMRQWLNSEAANGKWWTPQHNFDRTPDQLKEKHGFLTGFDEEFTKRLKATKVSTWKNTLTDNGDTDGIEVTYDKVFLPSLEAMSIAPQKAGEDDVWEYWKRASGMVDKMQQYKTYPQIRTFAIENHTSPQRVRLRSANRGTSYGTWYVSSDGGVNNYGGAYWAYRCAPACWLC